MGEQTGQSHSALRIVAACKSSAEFVAAYARYCEGRSLFIATKTPKSMGHIVKFKIVLASGEHLMTGVGPVVEVFAGRDNRFNRPGMRVEVEKLDASGRHWMEQLRARTSATPTPAVVSMPTGMFSIVSDESTATAAAPARTTPAPAVVSIPTGMFSIVSDESIAAAAAPAPAAAAPADPVLPDKPPAPVPVAVNDHLSAGWEMDGLPPGLALPAPRAATAPLAARNGEGAKKTGKKSEKNGEKPAAEKKGEKRADAAQQAVVASGELEVPPLPPPPTPPGKGRSKRITFPALMFNKPRGLAVPAPTGSLVPKPIALLPAASPREPGKLRPPTAPADREPGAPVAPLGTPADTEPHVMVPPVLEASIARPLEGAEGTPPPPAPPPMPDEVHPELDDAPPESDVVTSAPDPVERPRRSKGSTTTPPPIWAERTVTQTLIALVGGKPDAKVPEETVHWTNPGFAALRRQEPPQVDIVEEEIPAAAPTAVPVEVGVELSSGMDRTVVSPPPPEMMARRGRFFAAIAVTAVVGIGLGYLVGVRQGGSIEKMPVDTAASGSAAPAAMDREALIAECRQLAAPAADPVDQDVATPEPAVVPTDDEAASEPPPSGSSRARSREAAAPAPSSCYLNAMTSPAGATVMVDGRIAGRTPTRSKVSCGRHSVRFEMENYQAATRTINVRHGDTEKVSADLSRPRTVLRVESTPPGATVMVDGSSVGLTPLTTTVPGFVSSTIAVSKPGYRSVSKQISPTATSARVGVTLKADTSSAARAPASRRR